jgi:hypothetical protein
MWSDYCSASCQALQGQDIVGTRSGRRMYDDGEFRIGRPQVVYKNERVGRKVNQFLDTNNQRLKPTFTMQFTQTAFTAVLAIASSAAASPLAARQTVLQNFQVSSVSSYSPSGRPGSYPWAQITAEVTDPNEINLGTAESDGSDVIVPGGSQGLVRPSSSLSYFNTLTNTLPRTAKRNGTPRASHPLIVPGHATPRPTATGS